MHARGLTWSSPVTAPKAVDHHAPLTAHSTTLAASPWIMHAQIRLNPSPRNTTREGKTSMTINLTKTSSRPRTEPSAAPGAIAFARGLVKTYGDRRDRGSRAGGGRRGLRPRRADRDHGPVRVRQVDPDALHGGLGHRDRGHRGRRRAGRRHDEPASADPAAPYPPWVHLPGVQPHSDLDGRREHHLAVGHRPPPGGPLPLHRDRGRTRAGETVAPPPKRAVRRSAAAGGLRPGPGRQAHRHLRRRAHRQPGLEPRPASCWRSCADPSTNSARPS